MATDDLSSLLLDAIQFVLKYLSDNHSSQNNGKSHDLYEILSDNKYSQLNRELLVERLKNTRQFSIVERDGKIYINRNFNIIDKYYPVAAMKWRDDIVAYLEKHPKMLQITEIYDNVIRPKELNTMSPKILDVVKSDPMGRIVVSGKGDDTLIGLKSNVEKKEKIIINDCNSNTEKISRQNSSSASSPLSRDLYPPSSAPIVSQPKMVKGPPSPPPKLTIPITPTNSSRLSPFATDFIMPPTSKSYNPSSRGGSVNGDDHRSQHSLHALQDVYKCVGRQHEPALHEPSNRPLVTGGVTAYQDQAINNGNQYTDFNQSNMRKVEDDVNSPVQSSFSNKFPSFFRDLFSLNGPAQSSQSSFDLADDEDTRYCVRPDPIDYEDRTIQSGNIRDSDLASERSNAVHNSFLGNVGNTSLDTYDNSYQSRYSLNYDSEGESSSWTTNQPSSNNLSHNAHAFSTSTTPGNPNKLPSHDSNHHSSNPSPLLHHIMMSGTQTSDGIGALKMRQDLNYLSLSNSMDTPSQLDRNLQRKSGPPSMKSHMDARSLPPRPLHGMHQSRPLTTNGSNPIHHHHHHPQHYHPSSRFSSNRNFDANPSLPVHPGGSSNHPSNLLSQSLAELRGTSTLSAILDTDYMGSNMHVSANHYKESLREPLSRMDKGVIGRHPVDRNGLASLSQDSVNSSYRNSNRMVLQSFPMDSASDHQDGKDPSTSRPYVMDGMSNQQYFAHHHPAPSHETQSAKETSFRDPVFNRTHSTPDRNFSSMSTIHQTIVKDQSILFSHDPDVQSLASSNHFLNSSSHQSYFDLQPSSSIIRTRTMNSDPSIPMDPSSLHPQPYHVFDDEPSTFLQQLQHHQSYDGGFFHTP